MPKDIYETILEDLNDYWEKGCLIIGAKYNKIITGKITNIKIEENGKKALGELKKK